MELTWWQRFVAWVTGTPAADPTPESAADPPADPPFAELAAGEYQDEPALVGVQFMAPPTKPAPAPTRCKGCRKALAGSWRVYADGTALCLSCATGGAKRGAK